jgi:hypothetical protein
MKRVIMLQMPMQNLLMTRRRRRKRKRKKLSLKKQMPTNQNLKMPRPMKPNPRMQLLMRKRLTKPLMKRRKAMRRRKKSPRKRRPRWSKRYAHNFLPFYDHVHNICLMLTLHFILQEKKKKHTRALKVSIYHMGSVRPYTPAIMAESKAKLDMLAQKDKERMMLEEAKNNYEAYIYYIRNKLSDDEETINKVTSEEQREALLKSAEDAEEWMFDEGFNADLETYQNKYKELSTPAEEAFFRAAELNARPKAIDALTKKLDRVVELMKKWETTMEHITEEERKEVLDKVDEAKAWIEEKVKAQEDADPTSEPVFKSEDVPGQTKKIESIVSMLMK